MNIEKIRQAYEKNGFSFVENFFEKDVTKALLSRFQRDLNANPQVFKQLQSQTGLTKQVCLELYAMDYTPMLTFLWALTPIMRLITGANLVPTYSYFRVYKKGDKLKVHADRFSCEHSLNLTLGYADDIVWDFLIGKNKLDRTGEVYGPIVDEFGDEQTASLAMQPGDALLYKGVEHRHARTDENPNRWSAHLFSHWVDKDGPYEDFAFDKKDMLQDLDFKFT